MAKSTILAAASGLLAAAASATPLAPAYGELPAIHREGEITYLSGGIGHDEAQAMKRAAGQYPLELVFVQRDGKKENYLADMPVRIVDAKGAVVFEGVSDGPYFLAQLPTGSYTVSTKWDAWSFSRHVNVGKMHERVVFAWGPVYVPHPA
jgi:hypothetical protein